MLGLECAGVLEGDLVGGQIGLAVGDELLGEGGGIKAASPRRSQCSIIGRAVGREVGLAVGDEIVRDS